MDNETLVQEIKDGHSVPDNMQKLYENNLPLIKKFIKPYTAFECEDDLLQESFFGIWEAIHHYETDKNVKFFTFAKYYILLAVRKYIVKCGSCVKIPGHIRQKMTQYKRVARRIEQEAGREPSDAETASFMGISAIELQEIKACMRGVTSLDSPLSGDCELTLSDALQADLDVESEIVGKVYGEHERIALWAILERYTEGRENRIIKDIFINQKSMSSIAREQGIPLSRVRQIKESGLRKLQIGKARRELLEKLDIADSGLYRGGLNGYREHDFVSNVEHIAIERISAEERYEKHLAGIEEMHRKRVNRRFNINVK